MKARVLFTSLFLLGAGAATAAHVLNGPMGYTRKVDVPVQVNECEPRKRCPGGATPCTVVIDHDGNVLTAPVSVRLFDAESTPPFMCGAQLFEP